MIGRLHGLELGSDGRSLGYGVGRFSREILTIRIAVICPDSGIAQSESEFGDVRAMDVSRISHEPPDAIMGEMLIGWATRVSPHEPGSCVIRRVMGPVDGRAQACFIVPLSNQPDREIGEFAPGKAHNTRGQVRPKESASSISPETPCHQARYSAMSFSCAAGTGSVV